MSGNHKCRYRCHVAVLASCSNPVLDAHIRSSKRIVVLFRGSVLGGKDWTTNLNAVLKELKDDWVKALKETGSPVKVHRGFNGEYGSTMEHFFVCFSREGSHLFYFARS
jgi:hypothetical protein